MKCVCWCRVFIVVAAVGIPGVSQADLVGQGQVTRFHTSPGNISLYLTVTGSSPCTTGWFYAYRADFGTDLDSWRTLVALSLSVYAQAKTVSVFHSSLDCTTRHYTALDTLD